MSKPIKLSDVNKKWNRREKYPCLDRNVDRREQRERILIVCEGTKTEPNYFESIKRRLPRNVATIEIYGEGASTLSLVARAREIKERRATGDYPFDKVWVVFDRDSFPGDGFDNAITSALSDDMQGAWSNEAFELWYILHFEFRNTPMSRTDYQAKLSFLLQAPYRKNAPNMYETIAAVGNQKQAIAWARRLLNEFETQRIPPSRSNPCTTVFLLVEELNKFIDVVDE
jgi:hypothetical protein